MAEALLLVLYAPVEARLVGAAASSGAPPDGQQHAGEILFILVDSEGLTVIICTTGLTAFIDWIARPPPRTTFESFGIHGV